MSELAPQHPHQPEPDIPPIDLPSVPDKEADRPAAGTTVAPKTSSNYPPVILGCATFGYGIYSSQEDVHTSMPLRVTRLALRSGITAFDTSPHYHPSEIVLGRALEALRPEFPRESYQIITKAGKYGFKTEHHDYSPDLVKDSVERSLKRLKTDYLDVVYLHDVENITSHPFPCPAGNPLDALSSSAIKWGLEAPFTPRGKGDETILAALAVLRELQSAGKIRKIGIAGYPLPLLLRLSLLALHNAPHQPLDIVQTYAHQTLCNSSLEEGYLKALVVDAKVGQVTSAAPLSMGILTTQGGPHWHPARSAGNGLYETTREAADLCKERGTTLEDVASSFGFRELRQPDGKLVPVVIGCKNLDEVHRTLKSYAAVNGSTVDGSGNAKRKEVEEEVVRLFQEKGVRNYSWQSPGEAAFKASAGV